MRPPLRPDQIAHLNHEDEVAALRKTEEQYAERILQQEEEIRALRKRVEELEVSAGSAAMTIKMAQARAEKAEARLRDYDEKLSTEMPPDMKDWWENSKEEWPEIARWVLENRRKRMNQAERERDAQVEYIAGCDAAMEKLQADLDALRATSAAVRLTMPMCAAMPASPDVLNRLEEIEEESLPEEQDSFAVECSRFWWLLRLTRAMLESQGELTARFRHEHESAERLFAGSLGTQYTHHGKREACKTCQMLARAERLQKGEV